jgi:FMN-dependent NADH-azoreductase
MKTLLVHYTPRQERSRTQKLLDAYRSRITRTEIETLDLCTDIPDLFDPARIAAYYARNMAHVHEPSESDQSPLKKMLRMTAQLKSADIVALACPMFNFSLPATVKAWFDSVLHVGETIDPTGGVYRGLMSGRKALVIVTAGGIYSEGNGLGPHFGPGWEHAVSLATRLFTLMGYSEIRAVFAEGMAQPDAQLTEQNYNSALRHVEAIAQAWYS